MRETQRHTTPSGSSIDLCTDQETHLRSVLREAARHAALTALQQRIDITDQARPASKKGRKDMQGITPYVDLQATLVNTKPPKFTKNWRLWPSTEKGKNK